MRIIWCDDETCKHNKENVCQKEELHINKRDGEMWQGNREIHNTCGDYEV